MRFDGHVPISVPGRSRVHDTVVAELLLAFEGREGGDLEVTREEGEAEGGIWAGLVDESEVPQRFIWSGQIDLHNVDPEMDAYELLVDGEGLYLIGNSPRGLLQAVYRLQELVRDGAVVKEGFHEREIFRIRRRIFHQRFDAWPGERADIRYISHLGASHCLLTHDWQGDRRHMQGHVTSPLFPEAVDAETVQENHAGLRKLIEDCLDFGLEPCIWLTELPCQGGPWVPEERREKFLTRFPNDLLEDSGTYQGKVLCFSHPRVQEFYRDLLARFLGEFPEISTIFLFGLDADGEFCDPTICPRCRGMSKFAQRDRFIYFLIEEGEKVRPGLRVLTTGWQWDCIDAEEFLRRQEGLPAASGMFMAAEKDGWQAERQCHDLLREARSVCRRRGQLFIGYDDFHWGDDTVHGLDDIQDFPLGIGAKMERWHRLEVDGVFDHWGGFNQDISCNSVACRAFFLNPLADRGKVCREIAEKQFGEEAGQCAFSAWGELERAHAILSNHCTWSPEQWPQWYRWMDKPPLPKVFIREELGRGGEKPKKAGPVVFNPEEPIGRLEGVRDSWERAFPHYVAAIEKMEEAVQRADDAPLFYAFWWNGEKESPNCREHLSRQKIFLEAVALTGREIGLHFGLQALFLRLNGDVDAYRQGAVSMLQEEVLACREAADCFAKLREQGSDRVSERGWVERYLEKMEAVSAYLNKGSLGHYG
jgi:hypothetical protein